MPRIFPLTLALATALALPAAAQHTHSPLTAPGQSAFAALAEVTARLQADPDTDWSTVDIPALAAHLRDMSDVTLHAEVAAEPIEGGVRFAITGTGRTAEAIARMVQAHAATSDGTRGWRYRAAPLEGGATLDVSVPEADLAEIRALGFIGLLTMGMHHQSHHWMIATGRSPH